jgi:hypothetical protein
MKNLLNSPSFFGFCVAFLVAIGGLAYYVCFIKKENFYYIDNPTDQEMTIFLDNKNHQIAPKSFLKIELKKGKHAIIINNGKTKKDTFFFVNENNGIINPSMSNYYIYKKYYGYRANKDSIIDALPKIEINKVYYKGNIIHCHDLNVEGFDFGLDEPFPTIIQKDSLNERTKVFRQADFIDFYKELSK